MRKPRRNDDDTEAVAGEPVLMSVTTCRTTSPARGDAGITSPRDAVKNGRPIMVSSLR
jgi:hypothetical protein